MKKILISILILLSSVFAANSSESVKKIIEGNQKASIKLIVYESLTCGGCANFHKNIYPELKENFIDKNKISLEFRNFPLDIAALNASIISHCRNDGSSEILHFLFKEQGKWAKGNSISEINKNIKSVLKKEKYQIDVDECLSNKKLEDYILEDRISGVKKYKIEATPTLIINDKKFEKSLNFKNIKKTIEKML